MNKDLPTKIVKFRIVDFEALDDDQLAWQLMKFDKRLDSIIDKFKKDRYSYKLFTQYFSIILNMYYIIKVLNDHFPNMEGDVRMSQQLRAIKKKLGIS